MNDKNDSAKNKKVIPSCFISNMNILQAIHTEPTEFCVEMSQHRNDHSRWAVAIVDRKKTSDDFDTAQKQKDVTFDPAEKYRDNSYIYRENQCFEHAEHFANLWGWMYAIDIFLNRVDGKSSDNFLGGEV